jgi:hypothetical protein
MTRSLNAARLTAAGRLAIPWLVGPAALLMRDRSLELTDASPCQGLLELASIAALRLNPDLPVGTVFGALHTAVFVVAIAAFVALVDRSTRNPAIAASTGLAVGLSPLFGSTLSPPWEAAAFGACAAAALVASSTAARRSAPARRRVVFIAAAFLICALAVPPLILSLSRPEVLAGSGAGLTSCALARPSVSRALAAMGTLVWWLGPFALGLAALGGFTRVRWSDRRVAVALAAAAVVSMTLAAGSNMSAVVSIAPVVVGLWWLAACGLDALIVAMGRGPARAVVAAGILLLLPALEASRRVGETRDDRVLPRGHESQTLRQMNTRLDLVAQDATFVEEDASIDVLLRAAVFGGRRRNKPFTVVPPTDAAIESAFSRLRTVYAFPRRQADLNLRGFLIQQVRPPAPGSRALDGLGEITGSRRWPCRQVGATWGDLPVTSGRIGVTADSDEAIGPVVLYFGGETVAGAIPDAWPPRTLRGFHASTFDQRGAGGVTQLQADARDAGLPLDHPVLREPIVTRLTLHRTPRAPRAFAVALSAPFAIGAGKLEQGAAAAGHFIVCDAPAVTVSALPRAAR